MTGRMRISADAALDSNEAPAESKPRVLVVDDELVLRSILSRELSSRDYHVVTACDGQEALDKVKNEKFDLVISDVNMPRMDGLEMLDAIKQLDPDIEVIMSTGYGTIETAVSAMKRGAYDFVQKPFNFGELRALMEKALEKNELKALLGVHESSKAVFSSIKLESLLPIMARLSTQILKADDASIMLADPDGKLIAAATAGLVEDGRKKARLALIERVAGKTARLREPVVLKGPLVEDPRFSGVPSLGEIRSSLVFPLVMEGEVLGLLNVNRTSKDRPFTAVELRHATILGAQIAQALKNAKLYLELEEKIGEIQEMQSQLVQAEKLAAIGQLAAGVAHEINNPLTGILGFTEVLLQGGGLTPEQRGDLETILHQSKRCRKIVQDLLRFSRRTKPAKELVRLDRILDPALALIRHEFGSAKIGIQTYIPDDLPRIYADPSQLEQVFLGLIINARQAMADKAGSVLKIRGSRCAGGISLRFEDNGPGVPPENLGKVFDPFFTTKPIGKGTGLGLSIAHGIIEQHHGTIRVESQVGVGASFIIELPAHESVGLEAPNENTAGR